MVDITQEQIDAREQVEHPLDEDGSYDMEVWRTKLVDNAYVDQLGVSRRAHIVYERVIVHIVAKAEQYEYYGNKWYMSDAIGYSDDGRKWRYMPELVSYSGGGSWRLLEGKDYPPGVTVMGYWHRPPYNPIGYMLPDGTRATKLLENK